MRHLKVSFSAVLVLALWVEQAEASVVNPGSPVSITQSFAYSTFNGGDFVFSTTTQAAGCGSGWFLHGLFA